MNPLLAEGGTIDLEFAKWLLVGTGTALVGVSAFAAYLVKKLIELSPPAVTALNKSNEVIEENTEALRELEVRK